jgi:DNA-binding MarR family transcriptional regulator
VLTDADNLMSACPLEETDSGLLAAVLEQQIRTLASRFRSAKPKTGFSPTEWVILTTLHDCPGMELKELAERVRISASATAKVTRTLSALRLLEWKKDGAKRRQYVLSLTGYGHQLLGEGRSFASVEPSDWFRDLSIRELSVITGLLKKCLASQPPDFDAARQ